MLKTFLLSTILVGVSSTAVLAQNFSGAELGIEFRDVIDDDGLGGVTYFGSAEFDAFYGVSVALDATAYDFDIGPSGVGNFTVHVIYGLNPSTDIGLFLGNDFTEDDSNGVLGGEVAYDYGGGVAEGYIGRSENDSDDVTIFGAGATYDFSPNISVGADLDGFRGDDFSASSLEFGGFYTLAGGPKIGATIGRVGFEADGASTAEMSFGLQASIALGPNSGTTFGRRSAFEAIKTSPIAP